MAAVAMLFTACKKDNGNTEAQRNQFVYDGHTYTMESEYDPCNNFVNFIYSSSTEKDNNGIPLVDIPRLHIYTSYINKSFDLTKDPLEIIIEGSVINLAINGGNYGILDGNAIQGSVFKNGTYSVVSESKGLTAKLSGTLINDKYISFNLFVTTDNH